jgi:hypothetical protein
VRETAGARKRVEDAEAVVQQEQDDMTHSEMVGCMSREPEKTFKDMLLAIRDCVSYLPSSDDREDWEDEDNEVNKQGNWSEDGEPGWVMGPISKLVQQRVERLRQ